MAQSIAKHRKKILNRISDKKRGWVFTPSHFLDLGNRAAIDQGLSRLVRYGAIRRLACGLYDYPQKHPTLGDLPPNYERIAQALAGRDSLKLQPSGAYAANLLGLTVQVPAQIVFLTDGANSVGNNQKGTKINNGGSIERYTNPLFTSGIKERWFSLFNIQS